MQQLASITFLVRDYDEAITYFTLTLRFVLLEDTAIGSEGKRWVRVGPSGGGGTALLLAKATSPDQQKAIGHQSGGRVFLFLQTDNFQTDFDNLRQRGVNFLESPRSEAYGRVAVFADLYGNKWDLVEMRPE